MTITHDNQTQADLLGPMTELEFLQYLEEIEKNGVKFANRAKSKRASNPLSVTNEGWIVLVYTNGVPLLYDSIKSPTAYLSATSNTGRVVGKHQAGQFWALR